MKSSARRSDADNLGRERLEADKIVCVTFVSESARNWSYFSEVCRLYLDDVGIGAGDRYRLYTRNR